MAEKIKIQIVTACEEPDPRTMEVKGRNINTGLPKVVTLTSEEIRVALKDATGQIVEAVHGVLEKTPPDLAADIVDRRWGITSWNGHIDRAENRCEYANSADCNGCSCSRYRKICRSRGQARRINERGLPE